MAEEKNDTAVPKEEVGSSDSEPKKSKFFSCQYCDKKFLGRHALAGHQNAHWREKSEAKNLKRKRDDPMPSTYPSFFFQNLPLASSLHIDSLSRNFGLYQSGYPSFPLSNRFAPSAAHCGLNVPPLGRASVFGGNATVNFHEWQRYRERMEQAREFLSAPSSNEANVSCVETDNGCSANEKNLDLSLHL
ncbi:protein LATE FLOWERING-like [Nymphaea colorata]|uniref:protein LATE FLOWERING-like n=1 Tax=Nymphaea colorata TaxID=210225 RepID=UPI00129D8D8F|nr:protein LATE FLOWERING-like [Nymphaea colorata]